MVGNSAVRDAGLEELMRTHNFKQAIKYIDKKIKKQSKDQDLLTTRADLLYKNGDFSECRALCARLTTVEACITGLDAVTRLNHTIHRLAANGGSINRIDVEGLWQRAIKNGATRMAKLEIADRWMEECVSDSAWSLAAKAAASLSKNTPAEDPSSRKFYFWQIIAHWLSKPSPDVTDVRLRALGQTMACRMLEKAVVQTSVDDSASVSTHQIAQRQDFELLKSIYFDSDRAEQLLAAIDEQKLGMFSPPAVDEWTAHRSKLQAYSVLGRSGDSWTLSKAALDNAQDLHLAWKVDDWTYWGALFADQDHSREGTEDLAKVFDSEGSKARSPAIALLVARKHALLANPETRPERDTCKETESLYSSAQHYYDRFSHQAGCASELDELVCELPLELRQSLLQYMKSQNQEYARSRPLSEIGQQIWFRTEINVLKLDFAWHLHTTSALGDPADTPLALNSLKTFVDTCLRLYRLSRHQTAPVPVKTIPQGDEACLLAAKALVDLWRISNDCKYVVQSACLLTFLLEDSEYNADARLMLINMLLFLGLSSLAIRVYGMLQVKSLLINSCAPVLFNRMSTVLPFAPDSRDALQTMTDHLRFYGESLARIPQHQVIALDKENYAQAKDFDSFSGKLQSSITRHMLFTERRAMARLRHQSYNEDKMALETFPPAWSEVSMNFGDDDEAENKHHWSQTLGDKLLISEPPPLSIRSANAQSLLETVHGLACSAKISRQRDVDKFRELQALACTYVDKQPELKYITKWEESQLSVASCISEVMLGMYATETCDLSRLEESVRDLHENLKITLEKDFKIIAEDLESSDSWPLPRWQLCHQSFVQAQLLLTCHKLATKVDVHCKATLKSSAKASQAINVQTKALRAFAAAKCKDLKVQAAAWKKTVLGRSQDEHLAERVLDMNGETEDLVGQAIEETMGIRNAKRIIQSFASSLMVALDGIQNVDVS